MNKVSDLANLLMVQPLLPYLSLLIHLLPDPFLVETLQKLILFWHLTKLKTAASVLLVE